MEFRSLTKEDKAVLVKFAQIGKLKDGSFVLIDKDQMKVVHDSSTIQALFKFSEIKFDVDKPFNLFDATVLAALLIDADFYKFKVNGNKFILGLYDENKKHLGNTEGELVDYAEISKPEDLDEFKDDNGVLTINRMIISNDGMRERFERAKNQNYISGVLSVETFDKLKTYMKKIKGDLFTMSASDKENELRITVKKSGSSIKYMFTVEMENVNFPSDQGEVMFRFPLDYIIHDDEGYEINVYEKGMYLAGKSVDIEYLISVTTASYEEELKEILKLQQSDEDVRDELDDMLDGM